LHVAIVVLDIITFDRNKIIEIIVLPNRLFRFHKIDKTTNHRSFIQKKFAWTSIYREKARKIQMQ